MRTVHLYVMQELVRQRERDLRKLADCYGLLGPRRWQRRRAGRRQNRSRIQPARTCPEGIWRRAGDGGSRAA